MAVVKIIELVGSSTESSDAAVQAGTAGTAPMVCNDLVRAAILLTLGHLWENREDNVVGATVAELKVGAAQLLAPYRKGLGV